MRAKWVLARVVFALAVIGALWAHRRFPWIPPPYLAALVVLPVAAWRCARWRSGPPAARYAVPVFASLAFVALLPVPWMKAELDQPPGTAWQLDGRLEIDGTTVDPPGTWYWLTAGRPPVVAEIVKSWLFDGAAPPANLRNGRRALRPAVSEPAAAAVGLRQAGWPVELGVMIEVSDPVAASLPARAVIALLNGLNLTSRKAWDHAIGALHEERNTFTTGTGETFEFTGRAIPFRKVDVIDSPSSGLDVFVGGRLARTVPGTWFRNLAVGSSHGLMVALVSYAYASGHDLARGRSIAGTGTIRGDGVVGSIGDLRSKAGAARDVGADILLFPAHQVQHLDGFDPGEMRLVPVATLDEAIAALDD
jgi:PDZ domain-containing protein